LARAHAACFPMELVRCPGFGSQALHRPSARWGDQGAECFHARKGAMGFAITSVAIWALNAKVSLGRGTTTRKGSGNCGHGEWPGVLSRKALKYGEDHDGPRSLHVIVLQQGRCASPSPQPNSVYRSWAFKIVGKKSGFNPTGLRSKSMGLKPTPRLSATRV